MTAERIGALRPAIEHPLLVTSPNNVFYLTGFESSNAAVLVEPEQVRLFADARYSEAGRSVSGVEFVETGRVLLADLAKRLDGIVLFEEQHISYAGHRTLGSAGLELVPSSGLVEALRAIKDDDEIARIADSSRLADLVFTRLLEQRWVEVSERELAAQLQALIHQLGGEGAAFNVIVGSGPNGAKPHARPGERRIQKGDVVIVDFGVLLDGYRSDVTRTVSIGPLKGKAEELFDVVLAAHEAALVGIRPGMSGKDADAIARSIIDDAGYAANFGHSLGHGIGIEVHEAPWLSSAFDSILDAGQVVTIEPGIYLPDFGGVRLENLCVVREDGLESLTDLPMRVELSV